MSNECHEEQESTLQRRPNSDVTREAVVDIPVGGT